MRKILFLVALMLPLLLVAKPKEEKLFNGKNLKNWEIYIGAASGQPTEPIFTVVKVKGENM